MHGHILHRKFDCIQSIQSFELVCFNQGPGPGTTMHFSLCTLRLCFCVQDVVWQYQALFVPLGIQTGQNQVVFRAHALHLPLLLRVPFFPCSIYGSSFAVCSSTCSLKILCILSVVLVVEDTEAVATETTGWDYGPRQRALCHIARSGAEVTRWALVHSQRVRSQQGSIGG